MKPFLSYWPIHKQMGWEYGGQVTNFDFVGGVAKYFKRRKYWSVVPNVGWIRVAPEMLMLWEE